jgi:hypothetical protein
MKNLIKTEIVRKNQIGILDMKKSMSQRKNPIENIKNNEIKQKKEYWIFRKSFLERKKGRKKGGNREGKKEVKKARKKEGKKEIRKKERKEREGKKERQGNKERR